MESLTLAPSTTVDQLSTATIFTTDTRHSIVTNTSLIGSTATFTSEYVHTYSGYSTVTATVEKQIYIVYTIYLDDSCKSWDDLTSTDFGYSSMPLISPNPDVSGPGVLAAFLTTSWLAMIFLACAYWFGLLPASHLRSVDKKCFGANSRRCGTEWEEALIKVIFVFSDQQLITGVAILIAGFYEAFHDNLDMNHWTIVTYLAWTSSTVHLITLSLLGNKLNDHKRLRNIRVAGMLILLALLLVALLPTAVHADSNAPTRCNFSFTNRPDESHGIAVVNAAISYTTLLTGYIWKLAHLFRSSTARLHLFGRAGPQSWLEGKAKSVLDNRDRSKWVGSFKYRVIAFVYLYLALWTESLRSFMATMLALLFTLSWGTLNLLFEVVYIVYRFEDVSKQERTMSFGQILPLLLLLQPAMAIVAHFAKREGQPKYFRQANERLLRDQNNNSTWTSLADVLQNGQLLTAAEKLTDAQDPVIEFLFTSRAFKVLVYVLLGEILTIVPMMFYTNFTGGTLVRILVVLPGIFGIFTFMMPWSIYIAQKFSRKLR